MQQLAGSDAIFLSLETPTTHAHIGGVFVVEPRATELDDPVERLQRIHENTVHAKEMTAALRAREIQAMGEATYPISIIMPGMGLNITVLSYVDRVDFGFTVDPELIPDPWYLADGVPLALEELKDAMGIDHSAPLRPEPPRAQAQEEGGSE